MNTRRSFLKKSGLAAASLVFADKILANPYTPVQPEAGVGKPIRIRGAVRAAGKGLRGVAVSDGVSVVTTDQHGTFEFFAHPAERFVFISLPAGFEIPLNETGTARFYQPIAPGPHGDMEVLFDLSPAKKDQTNHSFFAAADPQMQDAEEVARYRKETVPDMIEMAGAMDIPPAFQAAVGDIMHDNLEFYPDFEAGVKETGIPGFQVLGNHDVEMAAKTDSDANITFEQHFGPSYYSFNYGEVHYVVLDDVFWFGVGYIGYLDRKQLDWLKADLDQVEHGKTVVVFAHIPAITERNKLMGIDRESNAIYITNNELLFELLDPYKAYVINGHTHEKEYRKVRNTEVHVVGAVCGAWWSGDICYDGTPNGYEVYTAKGSKLQWKYKSTGQPADHQMRVYPPGADSDFPEEIVANVWDATEDWEITWYENGKKIGEMTRRVAYDPLSFELHTGDELPEKRPWVDPRKSEHMFFAKPTITSGEVTVEAADPWGNKYSEKIVL